MNFKLSQFLAEENPMTNLPSLPYDLFVVCPPSRPEVHKILEYRIFLLYEQAQEVAEEMNQNYGATCFAVFKAELTILEKVPGDGEASITVP
jgi:hypothetical protein